MNWRSLSKSKQFLSKPAKHLIAILHKKIRNIEAYERFLNDVRDDTRLTQLVVQMKHDDEQHIELLKGHMGRLMNNHGHLKVS
jgi:hypothetical protein